MRIVLLLFCLQGVAALAQIGSTERGTPGPTLNWTLGVHRSQPSLSANTQGSKDGKASLVDTDADLGLQREGGPLGALLEYRSQAHGFRLAYDTFQFLGERALPRDIAVDGVPYAAGTPVRSRAKVKIYEGLYTYKFTQQPDAWVGFDLGVQFLQADLSTANLATGAAQAVAPSQAIPQIGISGWSSGADGLLESRVFYHYFALRGLTCHRYGLDARAYLYPGFGLRAFYESNKIKVPPGSTQGDLDIRMDATIYGLGLAIRF
jgi:hypothetical protein